MWNVVLQLKHARQQLLNASRNQNTVITYARVYIV